MTDQNDTQNAVIGLSGMSQRVIDSIKKLGFEADFSPGAARTDPSSTPAPVRASPVNQPLTIVQPTRDPGSVSEDSLGPQPPGWIAPDWMDDIIFAASVPTLYGRSLRGPRGTGKTCTLAEAARVMIRKGIPVELCSVQCNGKMSVEDLRGTWKLDGKGGMEFIFGPLTAAVAYSAQHPDEQVWLRCEEANMADPALWSYCNSLLDGSEAPLYLPNGQTIRPTPGMFKMWLLYNPTYVGTRPVNEAQYDRLPPTDTTYLPPNTEYKIIVASTGIAEDTAKLLCAFAKLVRDEVHNHGFDLSPRTLKAMALRRLWGDSWDKIMERELLPRVGQPTGITAEARETIRQIATTQGMPNWK